MVICVSILFCVQPALGWSNGGYSANPAQPDYGTHDWIAQHALDYLPTQEKQYITDNLAVYLYGTELPDNSQAPDGIGDTTKHHVYYSASGTITDDASAQRAKTEYNLALNFLKTKDYVDAAKTAGTMTHYIADLAVFGHVMGASTPWGAETHHSDYEDYVNARTSSYSGSFNTYLSYDGSLTTLTAYNAAVNIAYDTTFGGNNHLTSVWMDDNYNWNNQTFKDRCGQSLNLAVNDVADVLHTLYQESTPTTSPTATPTPSPSPTSTPSPSPSPTSNPTVTPTPTPTVPPTENPSPSPSTTTPLPTNSPTSTLSPSSNPIQNINPTPTVPEFSSIQILTSAMLTVMALAIVFRKSSQKRSR